MLALFSKFTLFHSFYSSLIITSFTLNMTEPDIVKSKKQRVEEGTAGSYFGVLPQRYGELLFLNFALRYTKFYLNHIVIGPQCVKFDII